jgi:3-hydroxyacyl-CoA dehydrogenase/enoyl-CoA hydratase/3-hydroxybutyryl-CoA epimerase
MKQDPESYRHWKMKRDDDGTVWLLLDQEGKGVNTLSRAVLSELDRLLGAIVLTNPAGMVICSGKDNGFIAGADVSEFSSAAGSSEVQEYAEWVHALFERLGNFRIPTVCAIRGFCLGGGLELALACRHRVAVDSRETRLGLPEVNLGIHPGFGGTVRLMRRIGVLPAFDLMLSGRSIDARRALRTGLVDCIVPERQWIQAVRSILQDPPPSGKRKPADLLWRLPLARHILARYLRRRIAGKAPRRHYPAPYALVDLWERFGHSRDAMFREEARSVANLVTGDAARNLVRVFFLREKLRESGREDSQDFSSVHVVGGGVMGADIAAWCALKGLRVTLQDVEPLRLADAVRRASTLFRKKLREPRLVEEALDRLIPDLKGDGISRADMVIEAIFEDASAKIGLYRQVEPRMRAGAILATNTSSIPLETLSGSLNRPELFVGLHFFNPVAKMQLVEVVRSRSVDAGGFERAVRFVAAIGRLPLPVLSSPGFLVNRILTPYLLEAVRMVEEGISIADIDRAALEFGMPMGPIRLADTVGLDICLSVGRILSGPLGLEIPGQLENLVTMGKLGRKSGQGFYRYKNGEAVAPKRSGRSPLGKDLADRMLMRLLNEAVACRREEVVSDEALLDAGVVFGIGFAPFRGGPLRYIRSKGVDSLLERLGILEKRYGRRFAPDPGWRDLGMREPEQV